MAGGSKTIENNGDIDTNADDYDAEINVAKNDNAGNSNAPVQPARTVLSAWNPASSVDREDMNVLNSEHLTPVSYEEINGETQGSASVVEDLGDSRQLLESISDRATLLSQAGTHLSVPDGSTSPSIYLSAPEIHVELLNAASRLSLPPPPRRDAIAGENLRSQVRESFLQQAGTEKDYLPFNRFEALFTRENVLAELRRLQCDGSISDHDNVDTIADDVFKVEKGPKGLTSRRKIFAILASIEEATHIQKFMEADLWDSDLPFQYSKKGDKMYAKAGDDENPRRIDIFDSWPGTHVELFNTYQWYFLAPYFKLGGRKVREYQLGSQIALPFLEVENLGGQSGNSMVTKVKIHPAHYKISQNPKFGVGDGLCVAVKKLKNTMTNDDFKKEIDNLKRVRHHNRVVELLMTYSIGDEHHLVFPCALGDLSEFWSTYKDTSDIPRDHRLGTWFAAQCLGISEGLKAIQEPESMPTANLGVTPNIHHGLRTHGRHGDMKPQNILWFRDNSADGLGHFRICDLGLSDFHKTCSVMVSANALGRTYTYAAPEADIRNEVSQSYDIFSFGCLLLEFTTWYLMGQQEIENFSDKRGSIEGTPLPGVSKVDSFFVRLGGYSARPKAKLKKPVADIPIKFKHFNKLRQQQGCTDYHIDLLNYIQDHMLRMRPDCRANSTAVEQRFRELHNRCKGDEDYCTKRTKEPPLRSTTMLSELTCPPEGFETSPRRTSMTARMLQGLPESQTSETDEAGAESLQLSENERQETTSAGVGDNGGLEEATNETTQTTDSVAESTFDTMPATRASTAFVTQASELSEMITKPETGSSEPPPQDAEKPTNRIGRNSEEHTSVRLEHSTTARPARRFPRLCCFY